MDSISAADFFSELQPIDSSGVPVNHAQGQVIAAEMQEEPKVIDNVNVNVNVTNGGQLINEEMKQTIQNNVDESLKNDLEISKDLDDLLEEINKQAPEFQQNNNEVIANDKKEDKSQVEDEEEEYLSIEEQKRIVSLLEEMQEKEAKNQVLLQQLEYERDTYKQRAREVLEKAQAIELDESKMFVPEELRDLVDVYNKTKTTGDKYLEERRNAKVIALAESIFKRSLDSYVSDVYSSSGEGMNAAIGSLGISIGSGKGNSQSGGHNVDDLF